MANDIYAAIVPIDSTMLACAAIIISIALGVQLITQLYRLRIVLSKERKRKTDKIPFLLRDLNDLGKTVRCRTTGHSSWNSAGNYTKHRK